MEPATSDPREAARQRWRLTVAAKLYEICIRQGYVDDTDWYEAAREARAEREESLRAAAERAWPTRSEPSGRLLSRADAGRSAR